MPRPARSIATLVQSIREELAAAATEGAQFCLALWQEADADAGYLVHVDGRMVPAGEYQYGFRGLDELQSASTDPDEEVQRSARQEAGALAGNLEPLDLEDRVQQEELAERLPYAFGVYQEQAAAAVASGKASVASLSLAMRM